MANAITNARCTANIVVGEGIDGLLNNVASLLISPGDAFVTKPKDLSAPPPPKPAPAPPPSAPSMFGRPGLVVDDQPAPPQNQGFNFMWGGGQPAQPQPPAPLQQLDYAMGGLGRQVADDSPTLQQLGATLREVSRASRSLQGLLQTLEAQPDALLRGRRE